MTLLNQYYSRELTNFLCTISLAQQSYKDTSGRAFRSETWLNSMTQHSTQNRGGGGGGGGQVKMHAGLGGNEFGTFLVPFGYNIFLYTCKRLLCINRPFPTYLLPLCQN